MGVLSALTHMLTFPQSLSSLERFGKVCGTVLYGLVWYGKVVRFCMVWCGVVCYVVQFCTVWFGMGRLSAPGTIWYDMVWYTIQVVQFGLVWYGKVVRPWPCLLLLLSVKPEGHWPWPRPDPFFEASNVCMYGFVRFGMVCYGFLQSGLLW